MLLKLVFKAKLSHSNFGQVRPIINRVLRMALTCKFSVYFKQPIIWNAAKQNETVYSR